MYFYFHKKNSSKVSLTWSSLELLFLFDCDRFDLKHNILRKTCNFHTASGWEICCKESLIHIVDGAEIIHLGSLTVEYQEKYLQVL